VRGMDIKINDIELRGWNYQAPPSIQIFQSQGDIEHRITVSESELKAFSVAFKAMTEWALGKTL